EADLRCDRQLALTLAVFVQPDFNKCERIVDGAGLVSGFPPADIGIGAENEPPPAILTRQMPGIVEVPPQSYVVRIGACPARNTHATERWRTLQRAEESLGTLLEERRNELLALLCRGPAGDVDVEDGIAAGGDVTHVDRPR